MELRSEFCNPAKFSTTNSAKALVQFIQVKPVRDAVGKEYIGRPIFSERSRFVGYMVLYRTVMLDIRAAARIDNPLISRVNFKPILADAPIYEIC